MLKKKWKILNYTVRIYLSCTVKYILIRRMKKGCVGWWNSRMVKNRILISIKTFYHHFICKSNSEEEMDSQKHPTLQKIHYSCILIMLYILASPFQTKLSGYYIFWRFLYDRYSFHHWRFFIYILKFYKNSSNIFKIYTSHR